jgi:hypothetical protein
MSAERIAVAGASPVPVTTTSQAHSMSDGSFLDAVQVASATKVASAPPIPVATATQVAPEPPESKEVPHPFFEHDTWNPEAESGFFGEDGFSLGDLLDVINPLQHIPVISSIYRSLTGDEISPAARLAGGTLYGGPVGLVTAFIGGVMEDAADTTLGDVVVAAFSDEDDTEIAAQVATVSPVAGAPAFAPTPADILAAAQPIRLPPVAAQTNVAVNAQPTPALFDPIAAALGQPKSAPSPLAFAREMVESPRSGLASPSSVATKSIIAADEMMRNQQEISDPVSAVLAARSQVPRGGAVGGLSTYRRSPVMTQPVEQRQLGQIPQTASLSAGPITSPAPANTRNGDAAPVPGKRGVPPLRANVAANLSPRRRAAASTPVPNNMVPKAMMSALDKYESMVQQREKPDADLSM